MFRWQCAGDDLFVAGLVACDRALQASVLKLSGAPPEISGPEDAAGSDSDDSASGSDTESELEAFSGGARSSRG